MTILFLTFMACHKTAAPIENTTTTVAPKVEDAHSDEAHAKIVAELSSTFARVHFAFDSSELTEESLTALRANAKLLQEHPRIQIQVQGHADERGTTDYNLALGQRRGQVVMRALQEMGVGGSRVKVVSLGEERPLLQGHDEAAWSANRRCEFLILVQEPGVAGSTASL